MNNNLSEKTIGNAISAYLMILVSWLFLFNKKDPYINNDFVKGHTRSAFLIHIGFLVTYIIFIGYGLFDTISYMGFTLNNIIANIIFIFLLFVILFGINKARNKESFNAGNTINIANKKSIIDIDGDGKVSEKEKLTVVLSYIPFIGYYNYSKYQSNKAIQDATRLNITISIFITLLYIFGHPNLANLFSLAYIVFITFVGINLFSRDMLFEIKLNKYFSPKNFYILKLSLFKYLLKYFSNKDFKDLNIILKDTEAKINKENTALNKELKSKKDTKIPKFLIYIPIINIIFLFIRNTKYKTHIINGLIITLITILVINGYYFRYINLDILILLLFPISFGIGSIKYDLGNKIPFIYDIYIILSKTFGFLKFGSKKIKEKHEENHELKLKPKK